jgi:hypothetical protein
MPTLRQERAQARATSRWIEPAGGSDFDFNIAIAHGIIGPHARANAFAAALEQTKPEVVTKGRRIDDGGHVALVLLDTRRRAEIEKMIAGASDANDRRAVLDRLETGDGPAAAARALGVSRMSIYRIIEEARSGR